MKNETDILRDLSDKFAQADIAYMLTGSFAMNYYAQPRMTRDIDVVVHLNAPDAEKIVRLFGAEYYVAIEAVRAAITNESSFNLIHLESVIKVDCIVRKKSAYRRLEFERRRQIKIQDFTTWIASKEDLIISKLYWSRNSRSETQLRDAKNLLATGYDAAYLKSWAKELGLESLLRECLG
jgi:hypothetical protein